MDNFIILTTILFLGATMFAVVFFVVMALLVSQD
jgi:hypothetical protein